MKRCCKWSGRLVPGVALLALLACSSNESADGNAENAGTGGAGIAGAAGNAGGSGGTAAAAGAHAGGSSGTAGHGGGGGANPPSAYTQDTSLGDADIVHLDGDRLYVMSWSDGLSVIDVSNPADLQRLGSYCTDANAFELFVRGQTVVALFSSESEVSRVVVLDVSDPAQILELANREVPGTITDARLAGDVLYVAAFENGSCDQCGDDPATVVRSFDLSGPDSIDAVDQVSFVEAVDKPRWHANPIAGSSERIYVAESAWSDDPAPTNGGGAAGMDGSGGAAGGDSAKLPVSHIQVVDIHDASGTFEAGASVELHGQLLSGSHVDEHGSVLRAVTQSGEVVRPDSPTVETFAIESSHGFVPLGYLSLEMPEADHLAAVHFDGDRAFVMSNDGLCNDERTSIVIVDLSDHEAPQQLGRIERSSCRNAVFPNGDQLFVFEQRTRDGGLAISLIDITDPSTPVVLDRTEFGHEVTRWPDDLRRTPHGIHISEPDGLILVPFAGYLPGSGVQVIDFTDQTVTARGVAEIGSNGRRVLRRDAGVIAVSLFGVSYFDITDHDDPVQLDEIAILPADD